jgi:hypothetical protein
MDLDVMGGEQVVGNTGKKPCRVGANSSPADAGLLSCVL